MNKLLLVEDNKIKTGTYELDYHHDSTLDLDGDISLFSYDKENYNLNINMLDNAILRSEFVSFIKKDLNLTININNNNDLTLNYLIINKGTNTVKITINMLGNASLANIKIRVINKTSASKANIICDGLIKANTVDNELTEDLKGLITNNDTIKISPNLLVKTNEVIANHKVTISSYNSNELFYLMSKGLSKSLAQELILKSFTTSLFNEKYKEQIKMEVKIHE